MTRKDPAAVSLGRKGGKAPHQIRGLATSTPEVRRAVALAGVAARWPNVCSCGKCRKCLHRAYKAAWRKRRAEAAVFAISSKIFAPAPFSS